MQNIASILQKAGKIQQKLSEIEKELNESIFEGTSGGNLVTVKLKGSSEISSIDFDDTLLKEEKVVICDLIVAAFNDAKRKLDNTRKEKMQEATGGLPIPPGLTGMGF